MLEALSLRSGEILSAAKVRHSSYRQLLPICPQCGEPVHLRQREIPYSTAYFAHHKEVEARKLIAACPLRVAGSEWARASSVIPNLSHGQFVDRFQRECCREIHALFGRQSSYLINFIDASKFLPLGTSEARDFVDFIYESADPALLLSKHGSDKELSSDLLGLDDAWLFLRSGYGAAVTNFIFQTAYFVAVILHPDSINKALGWRSYAVKGRQGVFPYEHYRMRNWETLASQTLPPKDKRNLAIPGIATTIVTLVLLRWRSVKPRINLLVAADELDFDDRSGAVKTLSQSPTVGGRTRRPEVTSPGDPNSLVTQASKPFGAHMQPTRTTTASADTSPSRHQSQMQSSNATAGSAVSPLIESMVQQLSGVKPRLIANMQSSAPPFSSGVKVGVQAQAPARPTPLAPPLQSRAVETQAFADVPRVVHFFEVKQLTPQPPPPLVPPLRASRIVQRTESVQWSTESIPAQLGLRAAETLSADEVAAVERSFPRSAFSITHDRGWVHLGRCGAAIDLVDKVLFPASCVREHGRGLTITHLHETLDARSSEVHWFT
jgi:hypothetical protein